jgi:ketosteroid isomerase-like protein
MSGADQKAGAGDADAVRSVLDAIADGFRARDAEAVNRHFAPDARLADLAPPLRHLGPNAAALQEWMDGWDGPIETTTRDLRIVASGDLAVCHGLTHTATTRGGAPAAWWARLTTVLQRTDEGWRIVHDHVSVPFYMDGSDRAAIDLEPEAWEGKDA